MSQDERTRAAFAGLVARYGLGEREHQQLRALLEVLARDRRAPTAVRSPERALEVHIADSLVALELEVVRAPGTIADLGAGAGFPGLVLAVTVAGSEVRLVESQTRKCLFMKDVIAEVGLENARAVCVRAEEWRDGALQHDVVVARAVAAQPVVLEYAAPLLRPGGTLVDWRGKRVQEEEDAAMRAAEELGLERAEIRRVAPFGGSSDHHLYVYLKVRDTPERFPRRAGMARKRPLGVTRPRR